MWACANGECSGPLSAKPASGWGFGSLYIERRAHCEHCKYPVFEIVICSECGQHYLKAEEIVLPDGVQKLQPHRDRFAIDEFELDIDNGRGRV